MLLIKTVILLQKIFCFHDIFYKDCNIILLALSIAIVSKDARYIRVVASESCPRPSLIIDIGIFLLFAMLAQAWRLTYIVSGMDSPNCSPNIFKFRLILCDEYRYCLRSSILLIGLIMGNK